MDGEAKKEGLKGRSAKSIYVIYVVFMIFGICLSQYNYRDCSCKFKL